MVDLKVLFFKNNNVVKLKIKMKYYFRINPSFIKSIYVKVYYWNFKTKKTLKTNKS